MCKDNYFSEYQTIKFFFTKATIVLKKNIFLQFKL